MHFLHFGGQIQQLFIITKMLRAQKWVISSTLIKYFALHFLAFSSNNSDSNLKIMKSASVIKFLKNIIFLKMQHYTCGKMVMIELSEPQTLYQYQLS